MPEKDTTSDWLPSLPEGVVSNLAEVRESVLEHLQELHLLQITMNEQINQRIAEAVAAARQVDISWNAIGETQGITRQGARTKWSETTSH